MFSPSGPPIAGTQDAKIAKRVFVGFVKDPFKVVIGLRR